MPNALQDKPLRPTHNKPKKRSWRSKILLTCLGMGAACMVSGALLLGYIFIIINPNLPSLDTLTDYRPKIPLRIYSADNVLIGEFGEERRNFVHIQNIPAIMKNAVLAIEDDRFYTHGGIDLLGILRATVINFIKGGSAQGASTITMQVARNFFLSSEKTYLRKLYEVLLAQKIESRLSKNQILELYMNQIYLGQRTYGFASAANVYFGKNLSAISLAEAAMLAGLPKAPSSYNPITNFQRAKTRQEHVLKRMLDLNYITQEQYQKAMSETVRVHQRSNELATHADYVAEIVRQMLHEQYQSDIYTRGFNVYTTINAAQQETAYKAVQKTVMDYTRRHGYRGPENVIDLPKEAAEINPAIDEALSDYPDIADLRAALVLKATPEQVMAAFPGGETITISGDGLRFCIAALRPNASDKERIERGAIIRVQKDAQNRWQISQLPEVESAFVALDPQNGGIRALIGGFDFKKSKFNHVTQAWRQPGSSFKPFIYSAALEKGFSPATIINDAPLHFSASETGGQAWDPKNYGNDYDGPITMRTGLMKSKNVISIRILQSITPSYAQQYITRFGFEADKHPPFLPMALGAGSVTPLEMAGAYAVFANGGYRINPYLISRVVDAQGRVLMQEKPVQAGDESRRVISARNDFIMNSLLQDVIKHGTGVRAMALGRSDLAGKTGTTNDSQDAWFCGYQARLVGIAWFGYDQPRSLGDRETGGGLALPIWIDFMAKALQGVPEEQKAVPEGIVSINGDYYFKEFTPGHGVSSVGMGKDATVTPPASGSSDTSTRDHILDLFKNP